MFYNSNQIFPTDSQVLLFQQIGDCVLEIYITTVDNHIIVIPVSVDPQLFDSLVVPQQFGVRNLENVVAILESRTRGDRDVFGGFENVLQVILFVFRDRETRFDRSASG
jgi:hypothetical protein